MLSSLLTWILRNPLAAGAVAAVVGLLLALGVQTVRVAGHQATIAKYEGLLHEGREVIQRERADREKQRADDERHARAVEGQLRDTAAAITKESDETKRTLAARADALARELRNRPERPAAGSATAAAAAPAAGATGAGLYRPDAEFLAGEAAAAARIAVERDECRAQYDAAREALKSWTAK